MTVDGEPAAADGSGAVESEPPAETERVHLSRWFRRRPTSLEFWDAVVAGDSLVWCFLGESFKSLLLRADVSQYSREELENSTDAELPGLNEHNVSVPLSAVRRVELDVGSRLRRAKLTVEWERSEAEGTVTWDLYGTSDADPQVELVESLASDDRFAHVDVRVRRRSGWF